MTERSDPVNQIPTQLRERRQRLLSWLEAMVAKTAPQANTEVSDELDHLLWLFAEDLATPEEERRMWALAAQEPGAYQHFQQLLASLSRHEVADLSTLPPGLVEKLQANVGSSAAARPATSAAPSSISSSRHFGGSLVTSLADVCLWVAREYLQPARGDLGGLALAGLSVRSGSTERMTSYRQQLLRRTGIYQLTIDHLGDHQLQWTLDVIQAADRFPPESVTVELQDLQQKVLQRQSFDQNRVRFRNLGVGNYQLLFLDGQQVLDQVTVSMPAAEETTGPEDSGTSTAEPSQS